MKVKVIVRDNKTLVLDEDAKKGDVIDLTELGTIDFDLIEKVISENKDKVYNEKLAAVKTSFEAEKRSLLVEAKSKADEALNALKEEILNLKNELKLKEQEITSKYKLEIQKTINDSAKQVESVEVRYEGELTELRNENKSLKENQQLLIEKINLEAEKRIAELTSKHSVEVSELKSELTKKASELEALLLNKEKEVAAKYEEKIQALTDDNVEKEKLINELRYQKSVKNVKQIGEELESWCDNLVKSYMQNGLFNCTWTKDNDVIKDSDETKGSKADFILKIFANEELNEEELLTSVCMDMKDENPDSAYKKKNEDYYKQLDKNRIKKQCKYAVLVSNLERDKANDTPIYKVREYEDMYVVRPEYLMTFINLLVSLNVKFKDLLLRAKKEDELFIESQTLKEEFEELKRKYLEDPLKLLEKQLEESNKQANKIIEAAEDIKAANRKIVDSYIDQIYKKLDKFNVKRLSKRLDKINEKEEN